MIVSDNHIATDIDYLTPVSRAMRNTVNVSGYFLQIGIDDDDQFAHMRVQGELQGNPAAIIDTFYDPVPWLEVIAFAHVGECADRGTLNWIWDRMPRGANMVCDAYETTEVVEQFMADHYEAAVFHEYGTQIVIRKIR